METAKVEIHTAAYGFYPHDEMVKVFLDEGEWFWCPEHYAEELAAFMEDKTMLTYKESATGNWCNITIWALQHD